VAQLGHLHGRIKKLIGDSDAPIPDCIRGWQDAAVMGNVFACDSLDSPLPRRTRKNPSGEYDRMLGVEEFYYRISSLPDRPDSMFIEQMPFRTQLTISYDLLRDINKFNAFLEQPSNKWLAYGKLGETLERYHSILKTRDKIVERMLTTAAAGTDRKALIAAGIAATLADKPERLTIGESPALSWIVTTLKDLRATLRKMNTDYDSASPTRQIEIRDLILKTGVPGDPILRRMWASRDAARSSN
jgi:hypothetical protein